MCIFFAAFFLSNKKRFIKQYDGLFTSREIIDENPSNEIKDDDTNERDFYENFGWLIAIDDICGNSIIERREWLNAPIIEFLNQLSYLKSKREYLSKK